MKGEKVLKLIKDLGGCVVATRGGVNQRSIRDHFWKQHGVPHDVPMIKVSDEMFRHLCNEGLVLRINGEGKYDNGSPMIKLTTPEESKQAVREWMDEIEKRDNERWALKEQQGRMIENMLIVPECGTLRLSALNQGRKVVMRGCTVLYRYGQEALIPDVEDHEVSHCLFVPIADFGGVLEHAKRNDTIELVD